MKPIHIILWGILIILLFCNNINAQPKAVVQFSYDNAGNRIKREIIYVSGKSNGAGSTGTAGGNETIEKEINEETQEQSLAGSLKTGSIDARIYPNPVKEQLVIELENTTPQNQCLFYLYDMNGKLLQSDPKLENITYLNFAEYVDGSYVLKLIVDNLQKEWVIVKQ